MKKRLFFYFLFVKIRLFINCFEYPDNISFPLEDLKDKEYLIEFNRLNQQIPWYSIIPTENIKNMLFYIKSEDIDFYYSIIRIIFMRNDVTCSYINVLLVSYIIRILFLQKSNENNNIEIFDCEITKNAFMFIKNDKSMIMNYKKYVEVEICFKTYKDILEESTSDFYDFKKEKISKYNFRKAILWFFKNNIDYILKYKNISELLKRDIFLAIYDCISFIVIENNENNINTFNEFPSRDENINLQHIENEIDRKIYIKGFLRILQNEFSDENSRRFCNVPKLYIETIFSMSESYGFDIFRIEEGRCFLAILNSAISLHKSENLPLIDILKIFLIKIYNQLLDQRFVCLSTTDSDFETSNCLAKLKKNKNLNQKNAIHLQHLKFIVILEETSKIFDKFLRKYNIYHVIYQGGVLRTEIINSYIILKSYFLNSLQNYEKTAEELKYSHSMKYLDVLIGFLNNFAGKLDLQLKLKYDDIFLISLKTLIVFYDSENRTKVISSKWITRLESFYNIVKIKTISKPREIEAILEKIEEEIYLVKREGFEFSSDKLKTYIFIKNVLNEFLTYSNSSYINQSKNHTFNCCDSTSFDLSKQYSNKTTTDSFLSINVADHDEIHQEDINLNINNENMTKVDENKKKIDRISDSFPRSRLSSEFAKHLKTEFNDCKKERNEDSFESSNDTNTEVIDIEISMLSEEDSIVIHKNCLPCEFIYTNRFVLKKPHTGQFSEKEPDILYSTEFKCALIDFVSINSTKSFAKDNEIFFENLHGGYFEKKIEETIRSIFKISKTCDLRDKSKGYIFEYEIVAYYCNLDLLGFKRERTIENTDTYRNDHFPNILDIKNSFDMKISETIELIKRETDLFFKDFEYFTIVELVDFIKSYFAKIGYSIQDSIKSVYVYTFSDNESTELEINSKSHNYVETEYNKSDLESTSHKIVILDKETHNMEKYVGKRTSWSKFIPNQNLNMTEISSIFFNDCENRQIQSFLTSTQNHKESSDGFKNKEHLSIFNSESENSFLELYHPKNCKKRNSRISKVNQIVIEPSKDTLNIQNGTDSGRQIESSGNNDIYLNTEKSIENTIPKPNFQQSSGHSMHKISREEALSNETFDISQLGLEKSSYSEDSSAKDNEQKVSLNGNLSDIKDYLEYKSINNKKMKALIKSYDDSFNQRKKSKEKSKEGKNYELNVFKISVSAYDNQNFDLSRTYTLEKSDDSIESENDNIGNLSRTYTLEKSDDSIESENDNIGNLNRTYTLENPGDNSQSESSKSSTSNKIYSSGKSDDLFSPRNDNSLILDKTYTLEKSDHNLESETDDSLILYRNYSVERINDSSGSEKNDANISERSYTLETLQDNFSLQNDSSSNLNTTALGGSDDNVESESGSFSNLNRTYILERVDDNISPQVNNNIEDYKTSTPLKNSRFFSKKKIRKNLFKSTDILDETTISKFDDKNSFFYSENDRNSLSRNNISSLNESDRSGESAIKYTASKKKQLHSFQNIHCNTKYCQRGKTETSNTVSSDCYFSSIYSNYRCHSDYIENLYVGNDSDFSNRISTLRSSRRPKTYNNNTYTTRNVLYTSEKTIRSCENETNCYSNSNISNDRCEAFHGTLHDKIVRKRNRKLIKKMIKIARANKIKRTLYFINKMLIIVLCLTLFWYFFY